MPVTAVEESPTAQNVFLKALLSPQYEGCISQGKFSKALKVNCTDSHSCQGPNKIVLREQSTSTDPSGTFPGSSEKEKKKKNLAEFSEWQDGFPHFSASWRLNKWELNQVELSPTKLNPETIRKSLT